MCKGAIFWGDVCSEACHDKVSTLATLGMLECSCKKPASRVLMPKEPLSEGVKL